MTDFYTVLSNALDRVGAGESQERDRVYDHVREVMIRKLRNHRPPLSQAEIDDRLVTFDAAIDRIEDELVDRSPLEKPTEIRTGRRAPEAHDDNPDSLDEFGPTDQEEGGNGPSAVAHWDPEVAAPEPMWGTSAIDMAWDESSAQWHDASRSGPSAGTVDAKFKDHLSDGLPDDHQQVSGRVGKPRWQQLFRRRQRANGNGGDVEPGPGRSPDRLWTRGQGVGSEAIAGVMRSASAIAARVRPAVLFRRPNGAAIEELEDFEEQPRRRRRSSKIGRAGRRVRRLEDADDPIAELAGRLDNRGVPAIRTEPLLLAAPQAGQQRNLYLPSPQRISPAQKEEPQQRRRRPARRARGGSVDTFEGPTRPRSRLWLFILLVFAAVVVGWSASVFVPILFPSGAGTQVTEPANPVEPEPILSEAEPAPAEIVPVEAFVLFPAENPTVFESGPDNPVRYESEPSGGYVRISSTIASGGARAVIDGGVADRLAGKTIHVVMDVRASPEQPAPTARLGYQRGLAVIDWQIVRVFDDYRTIRMTWRIPEGSTGRGDFVLIEPGVPGDGNAIDIRSLSVEIID